MPCGYIYLLQPLQSITNNENIYKIGKTKRNNFKRFNEYPSGSILIIQSSCRDCDLMEKTLLKLFNDKFIKKTEYGREYFEGDVTEMKRLINSEIMNEEYVTVDTSIDVVSTIEDSNLKSQSDFLEHRTRTINNSKDKYVNIIEEIPGTCEKPLDQQIISSINRVQQGEVSGTYGEEQSSEPYNEDNDVNYNYFCENCNYNTNYKRDFEKHLITKKHKRLLQNNVNNEIQYKCNCGKIYKHRQGLFHHKKVCNKMKENNRGSYPIAQSGRSEPYDRINDNNNLVIDLIKDNKDFKSLILEQLKNSQKNSKETLDRQNEQILIMQKEQLGLMQKMIEISSNYMKKN